MRRLRLAAAAQAQRRPAAPAVPFTTPLTVAQMANKQAVVETTAGSFVIDLRPDLAPNHVGYFMKLAREKSKLLEMDPAMLSRSVNEGFSGGEKKRNEILQMAVLEPKLAVLDETDSGLDIDALRIVAEGVNAQLSPELGVLLITHYQRILNFIKPDFVHVMVNGRIVEEGGPELAHKLEAEGYERYGKAA